MSNSENTLTLLNKEKFTKEEIHDIIKFVESEGGKKFLVELELQLTNHQNNIHNCGILINSDNKSTVIDQVMQHRGSYGTLKLLQMHFFDLKKLDKDYSTLFRQESVQVIQPESE
jgi:hypothetical protein